ncbi:MAG: hypothetical protein AAF236_12015 [Verrucomicrobiota bacterium]
MTEDYNPEEALKEYGYGKKSSPGKTVAIVLLLLLLIAAVGGGLYIGKLWSEEQSKSLTYKQQIDSVVPRVSELENRNTELSGIVADKQAEIERIREEWAAQVDMLEARHKEQLQRTYGQMNEIVYDSKKTLSYIGEIETRLREGQQIDQEESATLMGVINGLAFLHQQYQKPLTEFREVDRYLNQQLAQLPPPAADPKETTPLGRRLFKNREYQEERAAYFENQGRRSALVEARNRVNTAYASAQRQMKALQVDLNRYLSQLDEIVDSNEASAESVEEFFTTSREILKIHDRIMSIGPSGTPSVKP